MSRKEQVVDDKKRDNYSTEIKQHSGFKVQMSLKCSRNQQKAGVIQEECVGGNAVGDEVREEDRGQIMEGSG